MLLWLLALVLALAPAVLMLWFIRHVDRYEPEPWKTVGLAFCFGSLSVIPAFLIESVFYRDASTFMGTVFTAFVVVAVTEEVSKGTAALSFVWRRSEFNEVMDGIVYFGVGHMGFAVMENLKYVFSRPDVSEGILTAFARMTTAVPLHVIAGMIMGYHVGKVRFTTPKLVKLKHAVLALVLPVLLHGLYDLAAFNQAAHIDTVSGLLRAGFGSALMYAAVAALWLMLMPRLKEAQEASPWRPKSKHLLAAAPVPCPQCGGVYPVGAHYCPTCAASISQPG